MSTHRTARRPRGLGLRAVADALAGYGSASLDQLLRELDLRRADREALLAALAFWISRGDVREEATVAVSGGCAAGCCAAGRRHPGAATCGARSRSRTPVFTWVGPAGAVS